MTRMISVTILTKNNESTIQQTLESVKAFDDVVVLDSGSSDQTLAIAKSFSNVRVFETVFEGFGPMRKLAAKKAKHDWILSLDSDEELMGLLDMDLDPTRVYSFPFHNYFNGKWIKGCGWYPDRHVRLYHRMQTNFSDDLVHEKVQTNGLKEVRLSVAIKHTSYQSIGDFLTKMQRYSSLFSQQNSLQSSSIVKALTHGWWAFLKSYVLKRGFLCGREGFIISQYNGHTAYYKYLKLAMR